MTGDTYIQENITDTLKKGDEVIMVDCMEAKKLRNQKVWICKTDSFKDRSGQDVVFLEGYSGYFMTKFLYKPTR